MNSTHSSLHESRDATLLASNRDDGLSGLSSYDYKFFKQCLTIYIYSINVFVVVKIPSNNLLNL